MAVPDFQSMMLPILEYFGDCKEHTRKEIFEYSVHFFNITQGEQQIMLPSGNMLLYQNRAGWAKSYLLKARLIENTKRGAYKITDRGLSVLGKKPSKIDIKFLKQFSEYVEFREGVKQDEKNVTVPDGAHKQTPEEILEEKYNIIKSSLASELLDTIKTCSPAFFERLVVDLLTSMGYGRSIGESKVVGRSGDGGIDGIINEDKLGLESVYIQAKRWQGTVGNVEIRNFIGSLQLKGARKGVFITTSDFTRQAKDSAAMITGTKIVLIDGLTLADLMIEYNVGVSVKTSYEIKRIDSDYFEE